MDRAHGRVPARPIAAARRPGRVGGLDGGLRRRVRDQGGRRSSAAAARRLGAGAEVVVDALVPHGRRVPRMRWRRRRPRLPPSWWSGRWRWAWRGRGSRRNATSPPTSRSGRFSALAPVLPSISFRGGMWSATSPTWEGRGRDTRIGRPARGPVRRARPPPAPRTSHGATARPPCAAGPRHRPARSGRRRPAHRRGRAAGPVPVLRAALPRAAGCRRGVGVGAEPARAAAGARGRAGGALDRGGRPAAGRAPGSRRAGRVGGPHDRRWRRGCAVAVRVRGGLGDRRPDA